MSAETEQATQQASVPFSNFIAQLASVRDGDTKSLRSAAWSAYVRFRQLASEDFSDIPNSAWIAFPVLKQEGDDYDFALWAIVFPKWLSGLPTKTVERILNHQVCPSND